MNKSLSSEPTAQGLEIESRYAEPIRVAISGAAGRVGYSLIFRIAAGAMFGPRQPVILRALDVELRRESLNEMQFELADSAFPLLVEFKFTSNPDEAFHDVDWIILLASVTGPTPIERTVALEKNGPVYQQHGQAINRVAPRARVLVVGTPTHSNCLIAQTNAPSLPRERWFALNRLYQIRATSVIAEKLHVPVHHINRLTVWGKPGPNLYVDFHNCYVGDTPAWKLLNDPEWEHTTLQQSVGTQVSRQILLSSVTPAASGAMAILETVRAITSPTSYLQRFGAGVVSDGSYDVPTGLVFSLPLRTEDGRTWSIVRDLYLDEFAQDRIQTCVSELQSEALLASRFFGNIP
jgi:malate dehydrogenase